MKNFLKITLLICLTSSFTLQAQEGSVGIGTTTPSNANKLEVKASAGQQALLVNSTGDNQTLRLRQDNGFFGARLNFGDAQYSWLSEDSDDVLTLHSNSGLLFSTSGQSLNERMRVSSAGNIGMGDNSPTEARLVVRSEAGDALFLNNRLTFENGNGNKIRLYEDTNGLLGFGISAGQLNYHVANGNSHVFYSGGTNGNGTERMRITGAGQLYFPSVIDAGNGNGTINIGNGLFIDDNEIVSTGELFLNASNSGSSAGVNICSNSGWVRMTSGGGNVRIGDNPTNFGNIRLQVGASTGGNIAAYFRNNSAPDASNNSFSTVEMENQGNGIALYIVTGSAVKPGGGSWSGQSDRRLKQDINTYNEGLAQVRAIKPVTYRYNELADASTEDTYVGIIAQELQEIAPHMVKQRGEYLTVDPSAFTYMLINAVQEQDQIIQDQKKEIDELKARLDRIEALLSKE